MATLVHDLDLPEVTDADGDFETRLRLIDQHRAAGRWLIRGNLGHLVLPYEDCTAFLRDRRWHNAAGKIAELMGITDAEFLARDRDSILSAEGEVHTRLRRLVAPAFSPRRADRLRPFMREVIGGLVDAVAPAGRADIAVDICDPYPIPIICELLGAPKQDWQLFSRWAEDILLVFSSDVLVQLERIKRSQAELDEYTAALIAERRSKPADDLLTELIVAEEAGDRLDTEELLMMVNAVIIGGTDTTRNQLGCAVALLARHPRQWALLAERPELAQRAVEEAMRYFGAVRATARFASTDIEYRDVMFPAGTFVALSLAGANRDPAVFADPGNFDITAPPPSSPQLTFGSGIHSCLGAWLARAELQEALPILARRMPDLQLDGLPTWKPDGVAIFGPHSLPVTFTPTPS